MRQIVSKKQEEMSNQVAPSHKRSAPKVPQPVMPNRDAPIALDIEKRKEHVAEERNSQDEVYANYFPGPPLPPKRAGLHETARKEVWNPASALPQQETSTPAASMPQQSPYQGVLAMVAAETNA